MASSKCLLIANICYNIKIFKVFYYYYYLWGKGLTANKFFPFSTTGSKEQLFFCRIKSSIFITVKKKKKRKKEKEKKEKCNI